MVPIDSTLLIILVPDSVEFKLALFKPSVISGMTKANIKNPIPKTKIKTKKTKTSVISAFLDIPNRFFF